MLAHREDYLPIGGLHWEIHSYSMLPQQVDCPCNIFCSLFVIAQDELCGADIIAGNGAASLGEAGRSAHRFPTASPRPLCDLLWNRHAIIVPSLNSNWLREPSFGVIANETPKTKQASTADASTSVGSAFVSSHSG